MSRAPLAPTPPLLLLAAGVAFAACATARNYLDPLGPSYEGHHAAPGRGSPCNALPCGAPLRVVTFNIEHGRKIDRALEVLRGSEPLRNADVLALQEMDAAGVEAIARELGLNYVYIPSGVHPKSGRDFGCALLSPWPLEQPRKVRLPHAARITHLRRVAVGATLRWGEQRVRVYSLHLPSPPAISGGARREQVRAVLTDAEASPDPVVLAGDFNSHGIGNEVVRAGYSWPTRDVGTTSKWLGIGFSFDHVFGKGLASAPGLSAGVVKDNRGASDHRPVWAVLVAAR